MAINSRAKGKGYELEIASALRQRGYTDSRRTAQYCGKSGDASDVVGLDGIHIECKRTEQVSISKWMEQAKRDSASTGDLPAIFHRRNKEKTVVIMELDDWLMIYQAYADRLHEE